MGYAPSRDGKSGWLGPASDPDLHAAMLRKEISTPRTAASIVVSNSLTNPLLNIRQLRVLGKGKLVFRVVMSESFVNSGHCDSRPTLHLPAQVTENGSTLLDSKSILVVVY